MGWVGRCYLIPNSKIIENIQIRPAPEEGLYTWPPYRSVGAIEAVLEKSVSARLTIARFGHPGDQHVSCSLLMKGRVGGTQEKWCHNEH